MIIYRRIKVDKNLTIKEKRLERVRQIKLREADRLAKEEADRLAKEKKIPIRIIQYEELYKEKLINKLIKEENDRLKKEEKEKLENDLYNEFNKNFRYKYKNRKSKNIKDKKIIRKPELLNRYYDYDNIIILYDVDLINIVKSCDEVSKYIILQYLKNKNIIIDDNSIIRLTNDAKNYYKLKDDIIRLRNCYRCNKFIKIKNLNYGHHVIPLNCGGTENDYNKIFLCNKCHDYVEHETFKMFKNGKSPSIEDLKTYIRLDFPIYKD